jgi:hypothetical protein
MVGIMIKILLLFALFALASCSNSREDESDEKFKEIAPKSSEIDTISEVDGLKYSFPGQGTVLDIKISLDSSNYSLFDNIVLKVGLTNNQTNSQRFLYHPLSGNYFYIEINKKISDKQLKRTWVESQIWTEEMLSEYYIKLAPKESYVIEIPINELIVKNDLKESKNTLKVIFGNNISNTVEFESNR